jgi:hypothetical protein
MPPKFAIAVLAALASSSLAFAADRLPDPSGVPVPSERPDAGGKAPPALENPTPIPQAKPAPPAAVGDRTPGDKTPGDAANPPDEKPSTQPARPPAQPAEPDADAPGKAPEEAKNPPVEPEDEKEYAACLVDLKAAGAEFSERPKIDDGDGCGIDKPLVVREILPGIALKPEATMRCKTALQLNRWTRGSVLPSAELAFGADKTKTINAVDQATSYACRNRNSAASGKLSEHARGNAIDIAGFTFGDGSSLTIAPRERDSTMTGAFERAIMATGCLYFTTVLGPGSDAAHETHLHLDVIERKAGYRYCW